MTTFKPSIISFASVMDCKMILKELSVELEELISDESTLKTVKDYLNDKEQEVEDRYTRG